MKREELIEAMARAIALNLHGSPYLQEPVTIRQLQKCRAHAEAALAALEARGLVVVPREATEEMVAACELERATVYTARENGRPTAGDIWRAMITASQEQQT